MDFYDSNKNRRYPFAATATLTDDNGKVLPQGILADLSIYADSTYGHRLFVSAVTKKGSLCTVVISSVESQLPLAVATVNAGDTFFVHGASPTASINALIGEAISGSVVFGERFYELEDFSFRYSTPSRSLIHPRCVYSISMPANQHWAVFRSNENLVGDVLVSQDGDIELVFEDRFLGNKTVRAMIFRLRGSSNDVLSAYSLSQQRPESNTCEGGRILTINGVQADCCGRVFFEFRGCAQPTRIINHCGVVLECALAIDEICPKPVDYSGTVVVDADECTPSASATGTGVSTASSQPDAPQNLL